MDTAMLIECGYRDDRNGTLQAKEILKGYEISHFITHIILAGIFERILSFQNNNLGKSQCIFT